MLKKVKYKDLFDSERSDVPLGDLAKRLSDECETDKKNVAEKTYEETARKMILTGKYKVVD